MLKILKAVALAVLIALPANAATYWASSSQTGSGHTGADSLTNAFTLAEVNAKTNFADGDKVRFKTGTYTGSLDPSDNGSAAGFLTFEGWPTAPGAVTFTGNCVLDSTAASGNGDYVSVRGMTFNGSFSNGGTGYYHARWDSLTWCVIKTSFAADGGYHFVLNCSIGTGDADDTFTWSYPGGTGSIHWVALAGSKRNTIRDCTMNLAINSVVNAPIQWRDQDSLEVTRCRWQAYLGASSGSAFPWGIYGMTNSTITDSYFNGQQLAASTAYFPNIRDIVHHNTWVRDTIVEDAGGNGALKVAFMTSGNTDVPNEYNGYNTYNGLYVRQRGAVYYQDRCYNDTHKFCTYIIDGSAGIPATWEWADSATIYHCTFINLNSAIINCDPTLSDAHIRKNLFVGGAHITCNGQIDIGTTLVDSDSNMVYVIGFPADSAETFDVGGCSSYRVGSSSSWCTINGHDCNSHWGNPSFSGTTWSDISPYPSLGSIAVGGLWGTDNFVGSLNPSVESLSITTTSLTTPTRTQVYADTLTATGGALPYTWSITLDGGFTFYSYSLAAATGIISNALVDDQGTVIDVVFMVTDALGDTASKAFQFQSQAPTNPTPPSIEAKFLKTLGAVGLILTSNGGYQTYDVRYRPDMSLTTDNWDSFGFVAPWPTRNVHTYRWRCLDTSPADGVLDTILVTGLPPGTYTFGLAMSGNPTVISNIDSVGVPRSYETRTFPQVGLYGGAGVSSGSGFKVWQPFVNFGRTAVVTAEIDTAAQYQVISLNSEAVDSVSIEGTGVNAPYLSILAMQQMRAKNPNVKLLAEPTPENVYIPRPSGRYTSADTLNPYNSNWQMWRAVRNAGGGWGNVGGEHRGKNPQYTDSTGARGILWKLQPGYKNYVWSADTSSTTGGYTTCIRNVNLAYKNAAGTYVVVDSLVAVLTRHFISRTDPNGNWLWDGIMMDLMNTTLWGASGQYAIDYTRAGYSSSTALDTAWTEAHFYFVQSLRRNAILAGRPDFIIAGNTTQGAELAVVNGGMTENWPSLGGGTWLSNYMFARESQFRAGINGQRNQWIFKYATTGDSLGASVYNQTHYSAVRYGLGTACLTGATFAYEPSYAAFATGGHVANPTQGFHRWWFDEYRAQTNNGASLRGIANGWLGAPRDIARQDSTRVIMAARDSVGTGGAPTAGSNWLANGSWWCGDFNDAADTTWWFRENQTGVHEISSVGRVTDTTFAGGGSMKLQVKTKTARRDGVGYHSVSGKSIAASRAVVIDFYAKASTYLPVEVGVSSATNGPNILRTGSYAPVVWVDTTWTRYQITGITNATGTNIGVGFWMGDTVGTVWIDNVMATVDSSTVGVYRRPFTNGIVLVNPSSAIVHYTITSSDVFSGKNPALLTGITGRPATPNVGTTLTPGTKVSIPATDAIFLVKKDAGRRRKWAYALIHIFL